MQTTTKRIGSCVLKAQKRGWKSAEAVLSACHRVLRILFIRTSQIRRDWPTPMESLILDRHPSARWTCRRLPNGSVPASQDAPRVSDVPSLQIRTLLYRASA